MNIFCLYVYIFCLHLNIFCLHSFQYLLLINSTWVCKWPLAERWMDPHLGEPCSPRHRSSKMTLLPFCHKLSISWTRHPQHQSNKVWFSFSLFSRDQFFHLSFALNWHLIYVACLSLAPSTLFGEQYLLFTWISCNLHIMHICNLHIMHMHI